VKWENWKEEKNLRKGPELKGAKINSLKVFWAKEKGFKLKKCEGNKGSC